MTQTHILGNQQRISRIGDSGPARRDYENHLREQAKLKAEQERLAREGPQVQAPPETQEPAQPQEPQAPESPPSNLDGFIYVPSIKLYVAKQRTLHNLDWYDTHKELHKQGSTMPTIPQFIEFLKYLRTDYENKDEAQQILDEILTVRSPWRSEWLDAKFRNQNNQMYVDFNHQTQGADLTPKNSERLTNYLSENKTPGINLDDWLSRPTSQGLPPSDCKSGDLYYWNPRDGRVSRFGADSDGIDLYCSWGPGSSDGALGVRLVRGGDKGDASAKSAS